MSHDCEKLDLKRTVQFRLPRTVYDRPGRDWELGLFSLTFGQNLTVGFWLQLGSYNCECPKSWDFLRFREICDPNSPIFVKIRPVYHHPTGLTDFLKDFLNSFNFFTYRSSYILYNAIIKHFWKSENSDFNPKWTWFSEKNCIYTRNRSD